MGRNGTYIAGEKERDIGVIEPHQKRMIRRMREARFRISRGRENT